MLQRWQTVWILLAVLSAFVSFLFDISSGIGNQSLVNTSGIVLTIIGLVSIFSYKKRRIQILLNLIGIVINALLIGLLLFRLLSLSGGSDFPEKGIGLLVFPTISVLGLVIANHLIKKDEELVKSVDRFR